MQRGWDASKQIRALLAQRKSQGLPATHQWLADATGIRPGTISLYATENANSRRNLGMDNAQKIADALDVTVQDLGGPTADVTEPATAPPGSPPLSPTQIRQMVREELEGFLGESLEPLLRRLLDRAPPKRREAGRGGR